MPDRGPEYRDAAATVAAEARAHARAWARQGGIAPSQWDVDCHARRLLAEALRHIGGGGDVTAALAEATHSAAYYAHKNQPFAAPGRARADVLQLAADLFAKLGGGEIVARFLCHSAEIERTDANAHTARARLFAARRDCAGELFDSDDAAADREADAGGDE